MPRRPNYRFLTPNDLDDMARSLSASAQTLRHVSVLLENSGQDAVAVGHVSKVEDCTKAVQLISMEVERKLLLARRHTVGQDPEMSSQTPPDVCECPLECCIESPCKDKT